MHTNVKILHIAPDDKFIKAADWIFEQAFPGKNRFIILVKNKSCEPKIVDKRKDYLFYYSGEQALKPILKIINNYDLVVLHGLSSLQSKLVLKANNNVKFLWLLFGGEVYSNPFIFGDSIYGDKTLKKFVKKPFRKIKYLFRPIMELINKKLFSFYSIKLAAKKIDYLAILHKEDYELFLKKRIIRSKTKHITFTYYPIEFIFNNNKDVLINNNNILLGNSATPSNNHLEAFEIIKKLNISKRKIITPLSYGDNNYAEEVVKYGENIFEDNFQPLLTFLPLEEYNKIIQSCGIVIMNHYRQQAIGNVLASLWLGSKVFLDRRNTFYHYLKRIGCVVYSVDELNDDNLDLLNMEEIYHNRSVLLKEIGAETIIKSLKKSIDYIIKN
jgi:hypothetical protein